MNFKLISIKSTLLISTLLFILIATGCGSAQGSSGEPISEGDNWQVRVISASKLDMLQCGIYPNDQTYTPTGSFVILHIAVEFVPKVEKEEMAVDSKDVVLIDSNGEVIPGQGAGAPNSPTCCMGCTMSHLLVEGQSSLTADYLFTVDESTNLEDLKLQYKDYPEISLGEFSS